MEQSAATATEFDQLVREHQAHNDRFFNGNPELEYWVHDDGVTLHGGFGFSVKGWDDVSKGLVTASGKLSEGQMIFTPLGGEVVGDFAYLVGFEEGTVRVDGGERRPMKLKVTSVMRRVDGRWLCVHRHGEMLRT